MKPSSHRSRTVIFSAILFLGSLYNAYAQSMSAGSAHSVFVCNSGEAKATGTNTFGQLGNGTTTSTSTPGPVTGLNGIIASASRDQFTLFLKNDSTVWAVGYNGYGQFGNGTITNSDVPVQIPVLSGVIKIAAGTYHSLFLKSDSTVWSCGRNFSGELGDGTKIQKNTPVLVSSLTGIIDIAAGDYHSMFLKSDSTVWSCGDNQNGCLGLGNAPMQIVNPTQVSSISGVTLIAGGFRHSLFVKQDSTVWASGYNSQGQLGDGTSIDKFTPVQISSLTGIAGISAGQQHSLFLKIDGTVWSSGANLYGQLGDGTNLDKNTPVRVSGLTGIVKISASGLYHSLFLKNDQTFWASGANNAGQLGDGTIINRNTPVMVIDNCIITEVSDIQRHLHALIFPNPSKGLFTFQITGSHPIIDHLEICNLYGEIVYSEKPKESNILFDLSNKSKGLYFYKILINKQVVLTGKIVVN
ncbi:MAG: T9SS type A sorting domain-containing protein [Bacteroidota bacterium]